MSESGDTHNDYTYELAPHLNETLVSMIELSRHGYDVAFEDLRGHNLQLYGAILLRCTDPGKYDDYATEVMWNVYDEDIESTGERGRSAVRMMMTIYGTRDVSEIPSEDLAEAYFYDVDEVTNPNYRRILNSRPQRDEVDWRATVDLYADILTTATELYKRGFDFDDLKYTGALNSYVQTLWCAVVGAPTDEREQFYNELISVIGKCDSSEVFKQETETRGLVVSSRDLLMQLVGSSTPSISMDIVANLIDVEPDNKQLKKIIKQCRRRYSSLFNREDFDALTPLGKQAAQRLGIRSDVDAMLAFVQNFSQTFDSMPR